MRLGNLPSNFATYICEHVFRSERPVKLVVFDDEDNSLTMTCCLRHAFNGENVKVVGLRHLLGRHADLNNIDLQPGFEAELFPTGEWRIQPLQREEDNT
jgi:hypothetical protein